MTVWHKENVLFADTCSEITFELKGGQAGGTTVHIDGTNHNGIDDIQ